MIFQGDEVKIIRCKHCVWFDVDKCKQHTAYVPAEPDGFCWLAEMADGTRVRDVNEEGLEWTE